MRFCTMRTADTHNNNDNNIKNSNKGNMKQINSNAVNFSVEFLLSEHHSPALQRKEPALTTRCTVDLDHSWQLTKLGTALPKKDKIITGSDLHSFPTDHCSTKSLECDYSSQTKHANRSHVYPTYPADSTFESPDKSPAPPAQGVTDVGRYDTFAAPVARRDCDAGYNSSGASSVDLGRCDDSNDNETYTRERSSSVSSSTSEFIMIDCSDGELPKDNADGVKKSGEKLKGKKRRVLFTKQQTYELERKFCSKWYISPQERDSLAKELQMNPEQVKIWFQNHRYKFKRMQKDYHDRGIPVSGAGVRSGPYPFVAGREHRRPDAVTEYLCQEMSRGRALTDIARRASGVFESEYLHALTLGLTGGVPPYSDAWVRPAGVPYYPTHHLMQSPSPYSSPLALHQRFIHGLPNHYLGGMPASSWLPTTASR